jgi:transcription elongation factor SPT5
VIDQNGSVRNVLPSRIASKIAKRKDAVATDRNGAEIRHGDTVREMYGEQRSGVIMHIHRSFLFLHNKAQAENTGVIVVRTSNVVTVSAKGGRATGPDLSRMNPAIMQRPPQGGAMPPPRVGRDRLIGKTVGITKGSYKGLIGIVRETTEDLVRVELHTKGTKVMVPRTGVVVKE